MYNDQNLLTGKDSDVEDDLVTEQSYFHEYEMLHFSHNDNESIKSVGEFESVSIVEFITSNVTWTVV